MAIASPSPFAGAVYVGLIAALQLFFLFRQIDHVLTSRRFAKTYGAKPPKVLRHWDPFLGLDFLISKQRKMDRKQALSDFQQSFRRIGSTYLTNVVGDRVIFTDEPKNVQAILATQFPDFDIGARRRQATAGLLRNGIFIADGANWEHSRALAKPSFVKAQVADLSVFEHHVQKLISLIPRNGETVDMQALFSRLVRMPFLLYCSEAADAAQTLDNASYFFFGKSVDALNPDATDESQRFSLAFDHALSIIAQKMRLGPLAWLKGGRQYKEACRYVHGYVQRIIDEHLVDEKAHRSPPMAKNPPSQSRCSESTFAERERSTEKQRYVLLQEMMRLTNDKMEIRNQAISVLVGGRDTTAALLSSPMFVLARRRDIWDRMQTSVAHLEGRGPTYEEVKDLKYVRWILQESLRLYPVVPMNCRHANKDTTLPRGGGPDGSSPIFVPKGTICSWVVYSMHRRPDLWGEDADGFRPERWEGLAPGFKYLPFNAGPRICIGMLTPSSELRLVLICARRPAVGTDRGCIHPGSPLPNLQRHRGIAGTRGRALDRVIEFDMLGLGWCTCTMLQLNSARRS